MKSLQEYINIYRSIGRSLNLQGDSIELLSQMLANATYISEVEHLSYTQESSIERASHLNSKIQHCVNEMYSVFRGECPRVILNITSNSYFDLKVYDELATFNSFNLYYLGYYNPDSKENIDSSFPQFTYGSIVIPPNQEIVIIALISPKCLLGKWSISSFNQYYIDFLENNLSNDLQVEVNGEIRDVTRIFSDHIKTGNIFDLTLPDYGLRLYAPDIFREENQTLEEISEIPTGTTISLKVFRYSELDSYNTSELKNIKVKGTKLNSFEDSIWNYYGMELSPGLIFIKETQRDTLGTIHYKIYRDKYVGSILRSNSDIGFLLEEMFPEKICKSGTSFKFEDSKKTPQTVTRFGFIPSGSSILQTSQTLSGVTSSSTKNKVTLLQSAEERNSPLTVYSSNSNYLITYFNNNSNVSYSPENNPQLLFTGTKISLRSPGIFKNNEPFAGIIQIPIEGSGVLKVFHRASYDLSTDAVYDIIPSVSAISVVIDKKGSVLYSLVSKINISILKSHLGVSDVITAFSGYYYYDVVYKYISSSGSSYTRTESRKVTNLFAINLTTLKNYNVYEIAIKLYDSKTNLLLDEEIIPIIKHYEEEEQQSGSSTSTTPDNTLGLSLDLSNDVISLESNYLGEITTPFPITVQASAFSNGILLSPQEVSFSVEKSSGINCEISSDGLLTIFSIDKIKTNNTIIIKASYSGITVTSNLMLKTIITEDVFMSRELCISDDSTGKTILSKYESTLVGDLLEYRYENKSDNSSLFLWLSGSPSIDIYLIE